MASFTKIEKQSSDSYGTTKDSKEPKQSRERKKLEASQFLISNYIKKLCNQNNMVLANIYTLKKSSF